MKRKEKDHLTYKDAGRILDLTAERVRQFVKAGELKPGPISGRSKTVTRASVEAMLQEKKATRQTADKRTRQAVEDLYGDGAGVMTFALDRDARTRLSALGYTSQIDLQAFVTIAVKKAIADMEQAGGAFWKIPHCDVCGKKVGNGVRLWMCSRCGGLRCADHCEHTGDEMIAPELE